MNHGSLIFLGVLASFVASWWGLVFAPQLQIGSQPQSGSDNGAYPARRAGVAEQGREVYVANGCVHCHSQQVRQEGYTFNLTLTAVGTNAAKVEKLLADIAPGVNATALAAATDNAPLLLATNIPQEFAATAQLKLKQAGASAQAVFIPVGVDLQRNWGARRTVGADYLYDDPVQIGNSRLGPDLANGGARLPDANWHLLHLYDPRATVNGSMMPAYRYLFETRPIGKHPSPDALKLPDQFAPKPGKDGRPVEVIPTQEARQLVAYLQSLRVNTALFEAPQTPVATVADAGTNAPPAKP